MMNQALQNIKVLDLTRVLAGPYCTQIMADFGATIIKIEKPGEGDDTRKWGPPNLQDDAGNNTSESAYYLSANRGKHSLAIDIKTPEGQELIHKLLEDCDILIENFKTDGLKKYGLDYESIHARHPHIIYASITGFGQNGPLAHEPGYDFLAQAMSGLMSVTGEPDEQPIKVGVALSDIMTGLNCAIGVLMALNHRHSTGKGQHIDVALLDCTLASMTNIAQYYLTSGQLAPRLGNAHSTIVPYQAFEAKDGHIILAIGNDGQFARFCDFVGKSEWARDLKFSTNSARITHRAELVPQIAAILAAQPMRYWIENFETINVPCGPVNTMDQTFEMEQIKARDMRIEMKHPLRSEKIALVGSPIKMSETPAKYSKAPPVCGEDTDHILANMLNLGAEEIAALKDKKIIG